MSLLIEDEVTDNKRIRIIYLNDVFRVKWPSTIDRGILDREYKIHTSIKRCYSHNPLFDKRDTIIKSNIQVNRLDMFEMIDLYWEISNEDPNGDVQ